MIPQHQQKSYPYLDEFKILKTLGSGYHAKYFQSYSRVKLGTDDQGKLYAIKRYKPDTANLQTLQHQLNIMKALNHQNLVRLIDVRSRAVYKNQNGTSYPCFAIILEYVGGGELFDFVADTGAFSEKVTRTYFHQLMQGLHYMHMKGYAHRDIKPQNILIGKDYYLKLADFGFSCLIIGKEGHGILHTKLGTQGYMAPQIPSKNYNGIKVDIFAAGVILFIMYGGNPPFQRASSNDPYYKWIKQKNYIKFWSAHSRGRPLNFFDEDFKDLFQKMVAYNPNERLTTVQIANHPWVKKQLCTLNQIRTQFDQRIYKLHNILAERQRQQLQKQVNNSFTIGFRNRGDQSGQIQENSLQQFLQVEQEKNRKLKKLKPVNGDDLVITEKITHAFALLKHFINTQISLNSQTVIKDQYSTLRVVQSEETEDGFNLTYRHSYEVQNEKFTEEIQVEIRLGQMQNSQLVVLIKHVSGSSFYFKKIARSIKNLYAYCQA